MTQEEKDLLLKDLSARLPYHVKVKVWLEDGTTEEGRLDIEHNYADVLLDAFYYNKIKEIKPYLFPLSSITREQELYLYFNTKFRIDRFGTLVVNTDADDKYLYTDIYDYTSLIDWLNKNHFDYRGLIPMGLAIDATGLNIY